MLGRSPIRTSGDIQHAAIASRRIPRGAAIRNASQLGNTTNSQVGITTLTRIVWAGPSEPCAHAPTDAEDLRSLYAAADSALYQAKGMGRNQFQAASLPAPR